MPITQPLQLPCCGQACFIFVPTPDPDPQVFGRKSQMSYHSICKYFSKR